MEGRPAGGRPTGGRPHDARLAVAPRAERPGAPRPRPVVDTRGRVRRFTDRYGWRAYALPLLTIATIAVLVDLARTVPRLTATEAGATATTQAPIASDDRAPVPDPMPTATAEWDAEPVQQPQVLGPQPYVEQGAGTLSLVDGSSPVYGTGPLQRFVVEVEDGIGVDGAEFATAVETTLADPRSWGNAGRMSFQRVGVAEAAAGAFDFRVSLVSPGSMETYCPGVGTGGYTSCRYGDRAVVNLARWATAVAHYEGDIATYRLYVVNHEVGHVLGNGHVGCPAPGQVAPVMQQQTLDLQGCVRNAWPYP